MRQESTSGTAMESLIVTRGLKDSRFREQLLADPRAAIEEATGTPLPNGLRIRMIEAEPNTLYLISRWPATETEAADELSEAELGKVAGGPMFGSIWQQG